MRPSPGQRDRLEEIRANLHDRIAEAEREGWLGEVEGLKVSLAGAEDKIAQVTATLQRKANAVQLGMPAFPTSPDGPRPPAPLRKEPRDHSCRGPPGLRRGILTSEAGAGLLIDCGGWLHREDFTGAFVETGTSISDGTTLMAVIDWPAAIAALDAGDLPCGSGERHMLRLAASIAGGIPSASATP